ncbi:MAG: phosphotransferase [Actinomycetota bacterium]|nr:phosphotransferase [Actinomycetota bacterium]
MSRDSYGLDALAAAGLSAGDVLGSGVEGTAFDQRDGTVAKVWRHRPRADLVRLRAFYDAVSSAKSTVATPRVIDLLEVENVLITIEERLIGNPVWVADGTSPDLSTSQVDVLIEALAVLSDIPGVPEMSTLPVLTDEDPFTSAETFEHQLASLASRRVERFNRQMRTAIPDLDSLLAGTVTSLHGLSPAEPRLVHGDLIAANVLAVNGRATAIVDFGFLTTVGDPAFDAAVAASCFDMWGPKGLHVERALDDAVIGVFGYDPQRLATYRAAYGLVTACCFGDDLSEGHFAWCVAKMERPDVRQAIQV